MGEPVTPESLCPDSPELLPELYKRIKVLQHVDELLHPGQKETPAGAPGDTLAARNLGDSIQANVSTPQGTPDKALNTTKVQQDPGERDSSVNDAQASSSFFELNQHRLAGFRILSELGHGGMGVVHKAYDENLDQIVAIKMMKQRCTTDKLSLERFRQEARLLARLRHNHIIRIYTADLLEGYPYFVMEYHAKGALSKCMKDFAQPEVAARIVVQVASAIDYAHRQGVLHRDLKPANILLDSNARAVVSDFGLAKLTSVTNEPVDQTGPTRIRPEINTAVGSTPGTPTYMAPEQFYHGALTGKTDIWALGVLLFELISGKRPFQGLTWEDLAQQINQGLQDEPHRLEPAIPFKISTIIRKCLMNDPAKRYDTAGELADKLEQAYSPQSRRAFLIVAGILLAGGGVVMGNQLKKQADLDQRNATNLGACKELRAELQKNKVVELLGQDKLPRAYSWAMGSPFTQLQNVSEKGFSQIVNDTMLLDLLDFIPSETFSLNAHVKLVNIQSDLASRFVFYFSRELVRLQDRDVHIMYGIMFNIKPDQTGRVSLQLFGLTNDTLASQQVPYLSSPVLVNDEPMQLKIKNSGNGIICMINNKCLIDMPKTEIIKHVSKASFDVPGKPPLRLEEIKTTRSLLLPLNEAPAGILAYRISFEIDNITLSL